MCSWPILCFAPRYQPIWLPLDPNTMRTKPPQNALDTNKINEIHVECAVCCVLEPAWSNHLEMKNAFPKRAKGLWGFWLTVDPQAMHHCPAELPNPCGQLGVRFLHHPYPWLPSFLSWRALCASVNSGYRAIMHPFDFDKYQTNKQKLKGNLGNGCSG